MAMMEWRSVNQLIALAPINYKKTPSFLLDFDHPDKIKERRKRNIENIMRHRIIPIAKILMKHKLDVTLSRQIYEFIATVT